jgi:hypothetical protein
MLPPPAPIVWTATEGKRQVMPAIDRCGPTSGRPPSIRHTSVLVPPMSKEMTLGQPWAAPQAAAATTPAAGPDSTIEAARSAADWGDDRPPLDLITRICSTAPAREPSSAERYFATAGRR